MDPNETNGLSQLLLECPRYALASFLAQGRAPVLRPKEGLQAVLKGPDCRQKTLYYSLLTNYRPLSTIIFLPHPQKPPDGKI